MNVWAMQVEHAPLVLKNIRERPKKDLAERAERKANVLDRANGLRVTVK